MDCHAIKRKRSSDQKLTQAWPEPSTRLNLNTRAERHLTDLGLSVFCDARTGGAWGGLTWH